MTGGKNIEERIDAYFNQRLTQDEIDQFNQDLGSDEEFKRQFEFAKEVFNAIQDKEANQFEQDLAAVIREKNTRTISTSTGGRQRRMFLYGVAASILLLFGFWHFFLNTSVSGSELYADNYQTYEYSFSRDDETDDAAKLFDLYSQGKYNEFITEANSITSLERKKEFYLAMAFMETKQFNEAKPILQKLSEVNQGDYSDGALWYLALIYVQEGDNEFAKTTLNQLSNYKGIYAKKAKSLIQSLDN